MLDPAVALAFIAAHTTKIRLGTGIIILPQRNPVVLAKELASTDVLSNGRLIFGIGVGYLKPEFEAIGAPFDHKGARAEEWLAAMIALWSMPKPEFSGKWIKFKGVNAMPRPVQKPHPEIVFGGHSTEAYSRAARLAKGWYGFALDLEATAKCVEGLRAACKAAGRRFEELEISVTPSPRVQGRSRHRQALRRLGREPADPVAARRGRSGAARTRPRDRARLDRQGVRCDPQLAAARAGQNRTTGVSGARRRALMGRVHGVIGIFLPKRQNPTACGGQSWPQVALFG